MKKLLVAFARRRRRRRRLPHRRLFFSIAADQAAPQQKNTSRQRALRQRATQHQKKHDWQEQLHCSIDPSRRSQPAWVGKNLTLNIGLCISALRQPQIKATRRGSS